MAQRPPETVERVAVIGAGTIGASWAALFLAHGLPVAVYDPAQGTERVVRDFVASAWPALERLGIAKGSGAGAMSFHGDPAEAVRGAQFVQESGPENLSAKQALFARMEQGLGRDAIVASSTSGLLPSDLQAGRILPGRYLVGHPFNPPHLIPLVELVGGSSTDPAVLDRAAAFYAAVGKRTIRLRKELPGHVANRMQAALYREAIHLVLEGVASMEDVDAAVAYGPGLRWALMGPHLSHHLAGGAGGMRHLLRAHRPGHRVLVARSRPTESDPGRDRPAGGGVRSERAAADRGARRRARRAADRAAGEPRRDPPGARCRQGVRRAGVLVGDRPGRDGGHGPLGSGGSARPAARAAAAPRPAPGPDRCRAGRARGRRG